MRCVFHRNAVLSAVHSHGLPFARLAAYVISMNTSAQLALFQSYLGGIARIPECGNETKQIDRYEAEMRLWQKSPLNSCHWLLLQAKMLIEID